MVRGQWRRGGGGFQLTSKTLLAMLACIAMTGSAIYWWGVQSQLTSNFMVAAAFTAILVLAPPSLMSFLIENTPGTARFSGAEESSGGETNSVQQKTSSHRFWLPIAE